MKVENAKIVIEQSKAGKEVRLLLTSTNETEFTMAMLAAMGGHTIEQVFEKTLTQEQRDATMALYESWCDEIVEVGGSLNVLTSMDIPDLEQMCAEMAHFTTDKVVYVVEDYQPRPRWFDRIPPNVQILE